MDARHALALAGDADVRRAAVRAAPPVARLGIAVGRHLARRRALELGLIASSRRRGGRVLRTSAIGAAVLVAAAGAAVAAKRTGG